VTVPIAEVARKRRRIVGSLPPVDWHPGPPDFVGIGVQKAGTTWWYRLIETHPQVYSRHWQKEVHFFDEYGARRFDASTAVDAYARLFPRPASGLAGEWTPRYMADFWVAPLLYSCAPDAKLLVLLRDPVARYLSGVRHAVETSRYPSKIAQRDAFARGHYYSQLANFLTYYDRSRVLVKLYEECIESPVRHLRETFEFLGIDPGWDAVNLDVTYNPSKGKRFEVPPRVLDNLTELYRDEVRRLAATFPHLDLGYWPRFA